MSFAGEEADKVVDTVADKVLVIAVPVTGGRLCGHFGRSEWFSLLDVDTADKRILNSRQLDPPLHQPGVLPRWLYDQGVGSASSMGS